MRLFPDERHNANALCSRISDDRSERRRTRLRNCGPPCDFIWKRIAPIILGFLLGGCRLWQAKSEPSIEFSRVPPAAEGGPDKLDVIQGRVIGARPGQEIVLYVKSGTWWVQPTVGEPFTEIRSDATWINSTHLGTQYAALLVEPEFHPTTRLKELPAIGGGVAAVALAEGVQSGTAVSKSLQFSGYDWRIRNAPSDRGGLNNYDADNAWTDSRGALHLRIAKTSGQWTCAEVTLTRSLGYGSYSFIVQDTSSLEPAAVFSMFTWDYGGKEQNNREMDIEVSRWGDPASKNAQYVVQPFYIPTNVARFTVPSGVLTHSFRWEPGRASFRTVPGAGRTAATQAVAEHVFTSGVPSPGIECVRINLYIFQGSKNALQHGAEVVIDKFEYLP
jgi:hypothetical protein